MLDKVVNPEKIFVLDKSYAQEERLCLEIEAIGVHVVRRADFPRAVFFEVEHSVVLDNDHLGSGRGVKFLTSLGLSSNGIDAQELSTKVRAGAMPADRLRFGATRGAHCRRTRLGARFLRVRGRVRRALSRRHGFPRSSNAQESNEEIPMGENKTYSVNEIRRIREACRVFGVEEFALELLCEGLDTDQAKRRLQTIDDELKHKSVSSRPRNCD